MLLPWDLKYLLYIQSLLITKYGMAKEKQEDNPSTKTLITNNHGGTESILIQITKHKLKGNNYFQWLWLVSMNIQGKRDDDYLTNKVIPPKARDPKFKA